MDWQFTLGILTALGAVAGWFIVHVLENRRARESQRRELITKFLIDAYRRLERCAVRSGGSDPNDMEPAIADVQLFGSANQVALAQKFAMQLAAEGNADLDELLISLREELRRELRLEPVPRPIKYLRLHKGMPTDAA